MEKNWDKIGKVYRETREGKTDVFNNLFDALLDIKPDEINDVNNRCYIYRHYTEKYFFRGFPYGGYWSYDGDKYLLTDDLGLKIPRWKIEEVYATIARSPYGWAICRHRSYASWARPKVFKFRDGPVPGIRNWSYGGRSPQKQWQAIKADYFDKHDDELKQYKFKRRDYSDRFDDFFDWDRYHFDHKDRNWKRYRKTQWKEK